MEPLKTPALPERLGKNTRQVRWAFESLRELTPSGWRSVESAWEDSTTRDEAEDALSQALTSEGLRESWFALRKAVAALSATAAAKYAVESGEGIRTLEHPLSVNAWDGQHEATVVETLEPAHEDGFTNAACEMLGIVMLRPYVPAADFDRFWAPYEPVMGALPA